MVPSPTTSISFEAGDVDGTVTTTATAANGTVEVNGDGTISYTPAADYNGKDTITVTVTDNDGLTTIKSSSITVNDVNDAPTLTVDSTKTVAEDGTNH
jgi:VCBS repeat-containing protein